MDCAGVLQLLTVNISIWRNVEVLILDSMERRKQREMDAGFITFYFLGYSAVYSVENQPKFRRNISPPSSARNQHEEGSKKSSKMKAIFSSKTSADFLTKRPFIFNGQYKVISQKIELFSFWVYVQLLASQDEFSSTELVSYVDVVRRYTRRSVLVKRKLELNACVLSVLLCEPEPRKYASRCARDLWSELACVRLLIVAPCDALLKLSVTTLHQG
jgi:hypothetical protein